MKVLIVIPARMAATRLPGKPLADINGLPMILRVAEQARAAEIGDVILAVGDKEIAEVAEQADYRYVMTDPDLPSGSDRVHAALQTLDPNKNYEIIVNLQGDLPNIDPELLRQAVQPFTKENCDIVTLANEIAEEAEKDNPNVVKIAVTQSGKALYFSRARIPHGPGPCYHHIGIYAYKRAALERFVSLPPSPLEIREKLEQLRALEDGMTINVVFTDKAPIGVDTPEDLEKVRGILSA